jgi:hypothetical protein
MTPTCDGAATLLSRAACQDAAGTCDQGGHTTRAACEASNGTAGVYVPAAEYAGETVASAELGKIIGAETGYHSPGRHLSFRLKTTTMTALISG